VAPEPIERGVSNLELFFDLVFVFTLTQLTSLLEHGISVEAAFRTALILTVLFWMYGGFVWLTNQVPPDNTPRKLLLLVGMGALMICAMAIPRAFDDRGVAFGIGYLLVVIVHGALYVEAYGTAALRFVPANIAGALCVTAAGLVGGVGHTRYGSPRSSSSSGRSCCSVSSSATGQPGSIFGRRTSWSATTSCC
jgi:low temperature requirement protein LtrA